VSAAGWASLMGLLAANNRLNAAYLVTMPESLVTLDRNTQSATGFEFLGYRSPIVPDRGILRRDLSSGFFNSRTVNLGCSW
jgi:hypothetical protein